MREKTIEQKLVQAVKAMGGIAPKFVSPGFDGMPDRLVLLPQGIIAFGFVNTILDRFLSNGLRVDTQNLVKEWYPYPA